MKEGRGGGGNPTHKNFICLKPFPYERGEETGVTGGNS